MEPKELEIFVTAKKNLASIHFDANKRPFHRQQLFRVALSSLAIVLECLYLVYEANTVREYINSSIFTTIGIAVYIAFLSAIVEMKTIYEFIDLYETIVNKSKFHKQ